MFADRAKIFVRAGKGGDGCVSFRREAHVPRGGPDGGDGGDGGSVFLIADPQLHTLLDFHYRPRYIAENGQPGSGGKRSGKSGSDLDVRIPVGTRIFENDSVIADLTKPGQRYCVAKGGRGGKGNARFATPTNRAPRKATSGSRSEERTLLLELKLMADVGLVGLPNAGKSTLLSVLTAARPKIAPYPFTTLQPALGIVQPAEYQSFVMADIPGLIEGASEGKGLGYDFLRHVERTRVLVYLVEAVSDDYSRDLKTLRQELHKWNPDLLSRPSLTVLSKCDLLTEGEPSAGGWDLMISSVTHKGLRELTVKLNEMLKTAPTPEKFRPPDPVLPSDFNRILSDGQE